MTPDLQPWVSSAEVGGVVPGGRRIAAMGNSIVQRGSNPGGAASELYGQVTDLHYPAWACLLSGGRLEYGGSFATGSLTSTQLIATWLPTVIAAKPGMCMVGPIYTNDNPNGLTFAQSIANLTQIYTEMIAAGILPIAIVEPPVGGDNGPHRVMDKWVERYASRHGLPVVNFHTLLSQTNGTWIAAYNDAGDGLHPNGAGAKLMGQHVVDRLLPWLPPMPAFLEDVQLAGDTSIGLGNPLLLTDTGPLNTPDNWTVTGAPTLALANDASAPAYPLAQGRGNAWTITRAGADVVAYNPTSIPVNPGDRLRIGVKLSATLQATVATMNFRCVASNFAADLWSFSSATDVPQGAVHAAEVVVPSGQGITGILFRLELNAGNGTVVLAQPTMINLTKLGLA